MDDIKKVDQNGEKEKFFVDMQIMYKNILSEWHEGTILKVNNTTIRILNKQKFKILSIKRDNVLTMEEYATMKEADNL